MNFRHSAVRTLSTAVALLWGAGASFLDGLLRFDVGHGVHGGNDWRIHLYADGLL